ncbi:MAG: HYR domain-containing protein [Dehalococcoidales bacterium]|nr:HYR domain-containing protein [Dehalococcoidales bacterium]
MKILKYIGLPVLLLMTMLFSMSSPVAAAEASDHWTCSGPGTTSVDYQILNNLHFYYNLNPSDYNWHSWTFSTTAEIDATIYFDWNYKPCHCWFQSYAKLQVYADGPSGRTVKTLYDAGGGCGTNAKGENASVDIHEGYSWGFITGGEHYDYSKFLAGNLYITYYWGSRGPIGDSTESVVTDLPYTTTFTYEASRDYSSYISREYRYLGRARDTEEITFDYKFTSVQDDGTWPISVYIYEYAAGGVPESGKILYSGSGNTEATGTCTFQLHQGHIWGIVVWSHTPSHQTNEVLHETGTLFVTVPNDAPIADAGPDQTVEQSSRAGTRVTLDGSGSSDPDNLPEALSYLWAWDGGTASGVNPNISLPLGTTLVTLTVSDGWESATDTVTITVRDTTPPGLEIPEDVTVEQATADGTVVPLAALAYDICDADVTVINDAPSIFPLGTTTVTFSATDDSGNNAHAVTRVTVVDTTPPVLYIPKNQTVEQENAAGTIVVLEPRAVDICDASVDIVDDAPPGGFPLGKTVVNYTATDDSGNSATGQTVITVVDTTPPDLTIPGNVVVEQETADGTVVPLEATATDICDADVIITSNAKPIYPLGKTEVVFTAEDDSGNKVIKAMTVEVVDTTPPDLTVPADVAVEQATADGTVVPLEARATDICDADVEIASDELPVYPLGTTVVTFTATDDSGNSISDSMVVTVIDTTKPVLTVPVNVTVEQETRAGTVVPLTATATDICDADVAITSNEKSIYPLGSTTVTFTATDDSGNSISDSMVVTVIDTTQPVLTVPDDITVEQATAAGTAVSLVATATDICDTDVTIVNDAPAVFPLGTTVATFVATDDSGNSISDSMAVTVVDTTAPAVDAGPDITVEQATLAGTVVNVPAPVVSDICDAAPVVVIDGLLDIYPLGDTVITVTATDFTGNSNSDTMVVHVIDTTAPAVSIDNLVDGQKIWAGEPIDVAYTVSDICDVAPDIVVTPSDSIYPPHELGYLTITVTATDFTGNMGQTSVTVEIIPVPVMVDFDPDTFNIGANGQWVTVYIEVPSGYSAYDIDGSTVMLNGVVGAYIDKQGWAKAEATGGNMGDHDGDGVIERMVKFDRALVEATLSAADEVQIVVTGKIAGAAFEGYDIIRVIETGNNQEQNQEENPGKGKKK